MRRQGATSQQNVLFAERSETAPLEQTSIAFETAGEEARDPVSLHVFQRRAHGGTENALRVAPDGQARDIPADDVSPRLRLEERRALPVADDPQAALGGEGDESSRDGPHGGPRVRPCPAIDDVGMLVEDERYDMRYIRGPRQPDVHSPPSVGVGVAP